MAIIVEENKKGLNYYAVFGWIVFIGILAAASYYIFFAAPHLIAIPSTGSLSTIAPIATVNLDPQTVVNSAEFQALTSTIPAPNPLSPASVGRPNPFVAP